jgi:hypothetical protein
LMLFLLVCRDYIKDQKQRNNQDQREQNKINGGALKLWLLQIPP